MKGRFVVLSAILLLARNALSAEPATAVFQEWRPQTSGMLNGDTLTVRALWQPIIGDSSESTCVAYRIDDNRGRQWATDRIPGVGSIEEGGCDGFAFSATSWRSGLIVEVKAYSCWPSYPDVFDFGRFIFLVRPDSVAQSDWDDIDWNPSTGDLGSVCAYRDCIVVRIPVSAIVDGRKLEFDVVPPEGVAIGESFPVEASSECVLFDSEEERRAVGSGGPALVTIPTYASLEEVEPESLRIDPHAFYVDSALVRLIPTGKELEPEVICIGIRANGERLFIRPGVLESLGFMPP